MLQSILVAGGAGYIGSHTAKALKHAGYQPVVLDNLVTGNRFSIQFGPFEEGRIEDTARVQEVIRRYSIETAIFFAAHAYVGESTLHPAKYFHNNVVNAIQFIEATRQAGLKKIVFSSSCSIYGIQSSEPIHEKSIPGPLSPYAESKLFFEQVLRWYDSAYGLRSVSLRYFNAAGADPDGHLGELHSPETHLIPLAIYAALGMKPLHIFGNDYPTPDGTPLRDYIHVTDLADAHVRAMSYLDRGHESTAINLGAGVGTSVLDIIRVVEEVTGRKVPFLMGPRREGDAPVLVADYSKARALLEWEPRHSDIRTIVRTAWEWYSRHRSLLPPE